MTYYETRIGEKWGPRIWHRGPQPLNSLPNANHQRAIRAVQEVPVHLHDLTLPQMQEILGPDGKFTAGQVQR